MRTPIDMSAADGALSAPGALALLSQLGGDPGGDPGSQVISLGVLSGADLCVLGGTGHPVCWEPLKRAWSQLDPGEHDQLAGIAAMGMLRRGLIRDQPPGRGVIALISPARYTMSPELAVLLSARKSPALIIATHHESRAPAVTYFQPQGARVIVEEIPSSPTTPLDALFSYRLLTPALAAAELARWAVKPIAAARYQPRPPRLIGFFTPAEGALPPPATGARPASYQLAVDGDGERARVHGPGLAADLDRQGLARLLADAVAGAVAGNRASGRPRSAATLP